MFRRLKLNRKEIVLRMQWVKSIFRICLTGNTRVSNDSRKSEILNSETLTSYLFDTVQHILNTEILKSFLVKTVKYFYK